MFDIPKRREGESNKKLFPSSAHVLHPEPPQVLCRKKKHNALPAPSPSPLGFCCPVPSTQLPCNWRVGVFVCWCLGLMCCELGVCARHLLATV